MSKQSTQIIGGALLLLVLGTLMHNPFLWQWLLPLIQFPGKAVSALSHGK